MLAGAYDESASCVGDALYRHARTTFALSIILDGITMTMTAITIARRDRKRPALAALGWQHTHTSARRAVRQLGKLLTNNTASGITIRGVRPRRLRPHRQIARPFFVQSPVRFRPILLGTHRCGRLEKPAWLLRPRVVCMSMRKMGKTRKCKKYYPIEVYSYMSTDIYYAAWICNLSPVNCNSQNIAVSIILCAASEKNWTCINIADSR